MDPTAAFFDSHAHLADERLHPQVEDVLRRARAAGVNGVVAVGTRPDDWDLVVSLSEKHPDVFATVGIHPHAAGAASDEAFLTIRERVRHPGVVALGETGLDYHYDHAPRAEQRASFARHLEIAAETGLPVVVHARSADDDVRAMIGEAKGVMGVLHCFAGGRPLLEAALAAGWYISFSGLITFRGYADADLLRAVPDHRILVETDAPYLAPTPLRGKTNAPEWVPLVAARAAEIRGEDPAEFAARSVANTRVFYRLDS
ncbi:MAG: TatD family hydrolase [Gemmatimonadota bacterium]|nr:TatD family hydrolase [Gemmatimonadota bacterium]